MKGHMFDNITATRAKGRTGTSLVVSVLLHGGVIVLALGLAYARAHMPKKTEQAVAVQFRPPAPPPPPPPPPPAGHKPKTPRPTQTKKVVIPPTVIQAPKEVPKPEEKPPEPQEEEEDEGVEGGVEGGVVGGQVGGVVGGQVGGVVGSTAPTGPVEFNDSMTPPSVIAGPQPEYTAQALEHEVEGTMIVKCIVGIQGSVRNCRIIKSLPFMDRSVLDALQRRKYSPALLHGQPIEVDYTFKIKLTLPQ
jgi:protein TonB